MRKSASGRYQSTVIVDIIFTPAKLARIDEVSPKSVAVSDRYADMSTVNR
ncbi:MAG: hypothetical protein KME40_22660 [Komarekiella atlantica HA4396-MV6]|nr:hypothetical protein [Komarekiella atlantica HA4396-MV6]